MEDVKECQIQSDDLNARDVRAREGREALPTPKRHEGERRVGGWTERQERGMEGEVGREACTWSVLRHRLTGADSSCCHVPGGRLG